MNFGPMNPNPFELNLYKKAAFRMLANERKY